MRANEGPRENQKGTCFACPMYVASEMERNVQRSTRSPKHTFTHAYVCADIPALSERDGELAGDTSQPGLAGFVLAGVCL